MNENKTKDKNVIAPSEQGFGLLPELIETIPKTEFIEIWKDEGGNYHTVMETIYKRR